MSGSIGASPAGHVTTGSFYLAAVFRFRRSDYTGGAVLQTAPLSPANIKPIFREIHQRFRGLDQTLGSNPDTSSGGTAVTVRSARAAEGGNRRPKQRDI